VCYPHAVHPFEHCTPVSERLDHTHEFVAVLQLPQDHAARVAEGTFERVLEGRPDVPRCLDLPSRKGMK
jgi:hypothetical protein